jgi:3-methyl-2-oxobutanoate hydroxymethyltransferase
MDRKKVTINDLNEKKRSGRKITMLTAYDYPTAKIMDASGIDAILVGDSLGMVVLGYDSTVPVTMEEMLHHAKAARRGIEYALLIGDMPFMSYQVSKEDAVRNAARFMKEAGCDAVKIEGGDDVADAAKAITDAGIPVLGHLGLTPQTVSKLGGYRVQGKDADGASKIMNQALRLQDAGCFAVVLECVPDRVADTITKRLEIPTIGIGAGAGCDGQVLVTHDMLGLFDRFVPKFVKRYVKLSDAMAEAFSRYREEVESGAFPAKEHSFEMKAEELNKFIRKTG